MGMIAKEKGDRKMVAEKICGTCIKYKRPASDWGREHDAGSCGQQIEKIRIVGDADAVPILTDELVVFGGRGPLVQVKMGPNFGCIHWKGIKQASVS